MTTRTPMLSHAGLSLLALSLLLPIGCTKDEPAAPLEASEPAIAEASEASEASEPAEPALDPEFLALVQKMATLRRELAASPASGQAVLDREQLTVEQIDAAMFRIAADPLASEQFATLVAAP